MNAFGIDYQRTLSIICLREGSNKEARFRLVSDGMRNLIPNVVHKDEQNELWGSKALNSKDSRWLTGVNTWEDGSWVAQPESSSFWGYIYRRLYTFLGRVEPVAQNGYQLVVGVQAENYPQVVSAVERICSAAGFKSIMLISAPAAILCRWVAEYRISENRDKLIVVVVAVGDVSTTVSAYELFPNQNQVFPPFHVTNASSPIHISTTGLAYWNAKLLNLVGTKLKDSITPKYNLAMRDAALEFGRYLGKVDSWQLLDWTGPLSQKMYTPLDLTRRQCDGWTEVSRLTLRLPQAIEQALSAITTNKQPDLILVGGVGAVYPFAKDAAAEVGQIWHSANPEEDVARGAAWWHEVGLPWTNLLKEKETASFKSQKPAEIVVPKTEDKDTLNSQRKPKLIPPWKRD